MDYSLKFGSYSFPATFGPSSVPGESRIGTAEIPRRDGVVAGTGRLGEKRITVKGMLRADSAAALRTAMDDLLSAVNAGRQKLYVWDDRFIYAQKVGLTTDYDETSFKRYCFMAIEFLCDTALWEAETESSDTWTSPVDGATHGIAIGGNAYCEPVIEITADATGTLDIELALGDVSFTLEGEVAAGDVIVVDCSEQTVELATYEYDYMSLFDASFLQLVGNATNTLTLTVNAGSVAVSQIVTKWRNRWY